MKLTATEIDVLTLATEKPEPIPLPLSVAGLPVNPMLWPADWSVQVSLQTRWQTDITKPFQGGRTEAQILASRPSRKLRISMVGATKAECHAMIQTCLEHSTVFGAPVPIYPDAVSLQSVVGQDPNNTYIYGDFRYRRFFEGGRVVFMPGRVDPNQRALSAVFGTILEISPGHLKVSVPSNAKRALRADDLAIPCMDVELSASSDVEMLTDGVCRVSMEWIEVDGSSSLPATWPEISVEDPSLALPLCQVVDGLPLFPFPLNWADGVQASPSREIDSDEAGRSTVQEPIGGAYMTFDVNVMGYDRPSSWRALRFFDAMRGRAGAFWFIDPQEPWEMQSVVSTSACTIAPVGNATALGRHFKRAAFRRASGEVVIRTIASVLDQTTAFRLNIVPPLPDTSFVSVAPVYSCRFSSDSLEETWDTNAVLPSIRFSLEEQRDFGGVAYVGTLGHTEGFPGLYSIPGLSFLARAGAECFGADGRPAMPWPARSNQVRYWKDISQGPARTTTRRRLDRALVLSPPQTNPTDLIRFPVQYQNNGQWTIKDPTFVLPFQIGLGLDIGAAPDPQILIGDRHLWSTAGWTLFLAYTPQPLPGGTGTLDRRLFRILGSNIQVRIDFDRAGVSGASRQRLYLDDGAGGGVVSIPLSLPIADYLTSCFLTLRADSTLTRFHVWVNGRQALGAAAGGALPMPSSYTASEWFQCFDSAQVQSNPTNSAYVASTFGARGCANLMASFNRPLTIGEINTVHNIIATMYRCQVSPSVLYA